MSTFDARLSPFQARLCLLLGLAPGVACGAKVVFVGEGEGASGGGGATSSSGGSVPSTGGATSWCPDPGGLRYVCFQSNPCPDREAMELAGLLEAALSQDQSCTSDPQFCGCSWTVNKLGCGPDPEAGECCYYVDATVQEVCEGRPFTVEGHAVVAAAIPGADWIGPRAPIDRSDLSAAEREALGRAWLASGLCEHASIASFARFALELLALGAPPDLVRDAQAAMGDEIAHAAAAFAIAAALTGRDESPGPLAVHGGGAARGDAASIVAAAVREGCIGETVSALGAALARDQARDPAVRAALDAIAADELRHAELSWRFVAWALERELPDVREAVVLAFAAPPASAVEEPSAASPETQRAFGVLPAADRAALARDAWRTVIAPTAEALLARAGAHLAPQGFSGGAGTHLPNTPPLISQSSPSLQS